MESLAGRLLVASPLLADPNFRRTVVLLLEHNEEGAMGVVLNRPSEAHVGEHLPEWEPVVADPPLVFVGGPVDHTVGIGLERSEHPSQPLVLEGVGLVALDGDPEGDGSIRIFSGYSGWGPGQLEDELAENAWVVVDARADDVVASEPQRLWAQVLRRQPGGLKLLATFPPDLSLN